MRLTHDSGLFVAARLANPVLPQYHPKQLIELLNFGRIQRVKAILAHLLRCISGAAQMSMSYDTHKGRQRLFSAPTLAAPPGSPDMLQDDVQLVRLYFYNIYLSLVSVENLVTAFNIFSGGNKNDIFLFEVRCRLLNSLSSKGKK